MMALVCDRDGRHNVWLEHPMVAEKADEYWKSSWLSRARAGSWASVE